MMEELVLAATSGGSLVVRRTTLGTVWDVVVVGTLTEILLGATDIDYFRERLTATLDGYLSGHGPDDKAEEPKWVMMLASPHSTIFSQSLGEALVLTFYDVDAERRDIQLSLGNATAQAWRDLLVSFNSPDHLAGLR